MSVLFSVFLFAAGKLICARCRVEAAIAPRRPSGAICRAHVARRAQSAVIASLFRWILPRRSGGGAMTRRRSAAFRGSPVPRTRISAALRMLAHQLDDRRKVETAVTLFGELFVDRSRMHAEFRRGLDGSGGFARQFQ